MKDTTKIAALSAAGLLVTPIVVSRFLPPGGAKDPSRVVAATAGTGAAMGLGIALLVSKSPLGGLAIGAAAGAALALTGGLYGLILVETPILDQLDQLLPRQTTQPVVK